MVFDFGVVVFGAMLVFMGSSGFDLIVSQLSMLVFFTASGVAHSVSELVVIIVVSASGFGFRLRVFERRSKKEGPVGGCPSDTRD